MSDDTKIFFIVPNELEVDPVRMPDESEEKQGTNASRTKGLFGFGRRQISIEPEKVQLQIGNYLAIVDKIASEHTEKGSALKLDEIKLSLTISAEGNIGIASTSAEAGIEIVFKRS